MELILLELRKKLRKEKGLRNKILLEKAISALNEYQKSNSDENLSI